jgi:hypothetical protein
MNLKRILRLQAAQIVSTALLAVLGGLWLQVSPAGAGSLPDGRVYELVSPAATEANANVYVPEAGSINWVDINGEHGGIVTGRPFEVAPDGEAVVYAGDPPATAGGTGSEGQSNGDEYVAKRLPGGGWSQIDLQPTGAFQVTYEAFSSDLSIGILASSEPLVAGASSRDLYSHTTTGGDYQALYAGAQRTEYAGANTGSSGIPGMSHLLLLAHEALLEGEGPMEREVREDVKKRVEEGKEVNVLYDSTGGQLSFVGVLPNGKADVDASFGSVSTTTEHTTGPNHVISDDGSRIFWTDQDTEVTPEDPGGTTRLFVSGGAGASVQVDASVGGGGRFLDASVDGSKVFFAKGDLYEYDLNNGRTTDLTPGVEVLGLAGISEDGRYVYYVDAGYNLRFWHEGFSTAIATLSAQDGGLEEPGVAPFGSGGGQGKSGDWQVTAGERTTEVTSDGHSLLFMSNQRLTGYDNEASFRYRETGKEETTDLDEVFLYEAATGVLRCISCNPSGKPPVHTEFSPLGKGPVGAYFPITRANILGDTYQPKVISEDGDRVLFDSAEPLVPQDVNGWLDVYEWEREGSENCRQSQGCVYLISGATDPESSFLLGGSASGNDAFVLTRSQFSAQDRNDNVDVYDARVGGVQPRAAAACSGAGCQGVAPAPPIFATPSSATFDGVGNFPPASKPALQPKKKPKQCKRGYVKKKGKCVKRPKGRVKPAKGRK